MLFSVIIPIYNVEKYLNRCVDSVLAQTFSDFEVILVDDGSLDGSPQICDRYAEADNRVVVIHKKNGGVVSARKAGTAVARGEYILHADGDDWLAENLMEELAKVIKEHDAPDTILFDAHRVYADREELMVQSLAPGFYDKKKIQTHIIPFMMYDRQRKFLTAMIIGQLWNKAIKRQILLEHQCVDEQIYKLEDFACVYECIFFSKSFYYLDKSLYFYNKMNADSAVSKYDSTYFRNHSNVIRYTMEHLGVHSPIVKKQIEAFNVCGICIAVFHEMRHEKGIVEASRHIKKELTETDCLKSANCAGLPMHAKVFILLLKCRLYMLTLLMAKILLKLT